MSGWDEYWLRVEADREHDTEAVDALPVDEDYERQAEQERWA